MLIENLKVRILIVFLVLLFAILWILPNFVNISQLGWLPQKKLNYGLDIQGGLHLVMGVDIEGVNIESTKRMASSLKADLAKANIFVTAIEPLKGEIGELEILLSKAEDKTKVTDYIDSNYGTVLQVIDSDDNKILARYYEQYLRNYNQRIVEQAIETLRNRIDEFGVAEPVITTQGAGRILVQLPGIQEAEKAKALINTTAKLEFMLVNEEIQAPELTQMIEEAEKAGGYSLGALKYSEYVARINEDIKSKIPKDTFVYFEKSENAATMEKGKIPYLLKKDQNVGGEDLKDAFVSFGQFGEPEVAFRFNAAGAVKFGELTGNHIRERLAVVLDKVVKSAPSIKSKITDSGVIQLGAGRDREKMVEEAKMISMALRAGALPASLQQLEERTVGPTLGADSIARGIKACFIGCLLVVIFMLLYYRIMGFLADFVLILNVGLILALLSSLEATLTLPGIAGIALTVGMAVDANVLINERIKEELRRGASVRLAIKEGYSKAFSAIFDGNITTIMGCIILMYFGTGPVKGFGLTLLLGLISSMFTAIFVTRVVLDVIVARWEIKKLSI